METETLDQLQTETRYPDMYKVILHNDDKNSMVRVVAVLMQIFNLVYEKAVVLMIEAHKKGLALVTVTHLERAELYAQQMASAGLVGTIEKA